MRKELRPNAEALACDRCGRTILRGERTEPFRTPAGEPLLVCELCVPAATEEGWLHEAVYAEMPPESRRPEPRRSLLRRLRRERRVEAPQEEPAEPAAEERANGNGNGNENGSHDESADPEPSRPERPRALEFLAGAAAPKALDLIGGRNDRPRDPPRDPRHVRAVPSSPEGKVERALELFNASEHRRTIAGLSRTLAEPWVSAFPVPESPSEVSVVVAWELSWYRFRIDLGDAEHPVALHAKGSEIDELDESLRAWNGAADPEGRLTVDPTQR